MFLSKWLGFDKIIAEHTATIALLRRNLTSALVVKEQLFEQLQDRSTIRGILMPERAPGPILTVIIDYTERCAKAKLPVNPVTFYNLIYAKVKELNDQSNRVRGEGLHGSETSGGSSGPVPPTVANNGTDPRSGAGSGPDGGALGQEQKN